MARHAAEHDWITTQALEAVAAHKATDEQRPSKREALLGSDTSDNTKRSRAFTAPLCLACIGKLALHERQHHME